MAPTYRLWTDIHAKDTADDLRQLFNRWPEAELLSIPQTINNSAVVAFTWRPGQADETTVRVAYDQQQRYQDNLRAIYLTLNGLRLAYFRGLGDVLTHTVSQMLRLGQAAETVDPYELLGVRPDAPMTAIKAVFRALSKEYHPDTAAEGKADPTMVDALAKAMASIERERGEAA